MQLCLSTSAPGWYLNIIGKFPPLLNDDLGFQLYMSVPNNHLATRGSKSGFNATSVNSDEFAGLPARRIAPGR
jgi:hypothetical protein